MGEVVKSHDRFVRKRELAMNHTEELPIQGSEKYIIGTIIVLIHLLNVIYSFGTFSESNLQYLSDILVTTPP